MRRCSGRPTARPRRCPTLWPAVRLLSLPRSNAPLHLTSSPLSQKAWDGDNATVLRAPDGSPAALPDSVAVLEVSVALLFGGTDKLEAAVKVGCVGGWGGLQ